MAVSRGTKEPAPETAHTAYARWRLSLDFRTCPSLEEAFTAGWQACPQQIVTQIVTQVVEQDALAYDDGERAGRERGYIQGYAKAERKHAAAWRRLEERERVVEQRERALLISDPAVDLSAVQWSPHEAVVLGLLCSQIDRTASAAAIHARIWGHLGRPNSVRMLISVIRAKLPKDWCLGRGLGGYRLHRIGTEPPCARSRTDGAYVPRCRQP